MAIKRISGADRGYDEVVVASLTASTDTVAAYDRANGDVQSATSGTSAEDVAGVFVQAVVSADTTALVQRITKDDEYVADTTNNSNVAHNYQRMVLTNSGEVNNTGTDSATDEAVFMQTGVVGAAADKKIRGRFVIRQDSSAV